jgi:hypothetical protein
MACCGSAVYLSGFSPVFHPCQESGQANTTLSCLRALALCTACTGALSLAAAPSSPIDVLWFDLQAAASAESLTYEEQLLAFTFQGLVNREGAGLLPQLMYDAA